ncbi:DUF5366 family protein [Psychrobacillus lasiicapitis]|uniref:YufK family protein n=1 Tax=Psychrobacillus lasiicapitis TaxID=1636719 RepID=A0A544T071_9BACI|nr:DUF5366 family protein [Psychrobacillus lasiicapitis]TQR10825.1 hypothetical protein FG382_17365 [Psychrobacillus lasiicapitis]GGA42173.1 hypothetical protein GCM10011384_34820 [Psychrobacillus lasiicapitis]
MKNPYVFGFLPLITILLFSLTFSVFTMNKAIALFKVIGVYSGMREFLSDLELKLFLLIILVLIYFMLFSALKLIAETIHEIGMLFFSKDLEGKTISQARGGYVIFFVGAIISAVGLQSIQVLLLIFLATSFIYFIYVVFKLSNSMSLLGTIGLIMFEIIMWSLFLALVIYAMIKLYNGVIASLPFL